MGSLELQVLIALGAVLIAVLIALAVDFLKGSNERLRERNAALAERGRAAEERAREIERLHRQMLELVETLKDSEKMRPLTPSPPMVWKQSAKIPEPEVGKAAPVEPAMPEACLSVVTETPLPESPIAVRVVRDEADLVSQDEVIEEIPPEAGLIAAGLDAPAYGQRKTRRFVGEPASSSWGSESEPELPVSGLRTEAPDWQNWVLPEPTVEAEEVKPVRAEPAAVESNVVEMPSPTVAAARVGAVDIHESQVIPGGVHPPSVLSELLLSEETFLGVTLSISVVDYVRLTAENGKEAVEQVMSALETLVQSSGNPSDLVCRISEDEFIVVCPGATGAAATSRVQLLSENLWDFQLRSLVSFAILFSWGASESGLMPNMPRILADSVDRAREQMLESRRSRRALTWASAKYGLQSSAG